MVATSGYVKDDEAARIADRIVQYERNEKTGFGNLMGFEARDGALSKIMKTLGVGGMFLGTLASTLAFPVIDLSIASFAVAPITLPLVAGGIAAAFGLAAVQRGIQKTLFSDMHDNQRGPIGKFGHYMGVGLGVGAGAAAILLSGGAAAYFAMGGAAPTLAVLGQTILPVLAGAGLTFLGTKTFSGLFGDKGFRNTNQEAKQLAAERLNDLSLHHSRERAVTHGKVSEARYAGSVTPEEAARLEARMKHTGSSHHSFAEQVEQQRAALQQEQLR